MKGKRSVSEHPKAHKFLSSVDPDSILLQDGMKDEREYTVCKGVIPDEGVDVSSKRDKDDISKIQGIPVEIRVYTPGNATGLIFWYKLLQGAEHIHLPIGLVIVDKNDGFVFKATQPYPILDNPPDTLVGCMNASLAIVEGVMKIHSLGRPTSSTGGINTEHIRVASDGTILIDTPRPCLPDTSLREIEDLMKKDVLGVGYILSCIWKLNKNAISQDEPMPKPKRNGKQPLPFRIPIVIEKVLKAFDALNQTGLSSSSSFSKSVSSSTVCSGSCLNSTYFNNNEITLKEIHKILSMEMENIICSISNISPPQASSHANGDKKDLKKSKKENAAAMALYESALGAYVGKGFLSPMCTILTGSFLGNAYGQDRSAATAMRESRVSDDELINKLELVSQTVTSMSSKLKLLITNNNRLTTALMQQKERLKALENNPIITSGSGAAKDEHHTADQQNAGAVEKTSASGDEREHGSNKKEYEETSTVSASNIISPGIALEKSGIGAGSLNYPPLPPDFMETLNTLKTELNALASNKDENGNIRFINVDNKKVLREYVFLPPHEINKKVPRVIPWGNLSGSAINKLEPGNKELSMNVASVNVPPNVVDSFSVNGVGFANIEKLTSISLSDYETIIATCSYHDVTVARSYIISLTQVVKPLQNEETGEENENEEEHPSHYHVTFNLHVYGVTDASYFVLSGVEDEGEEETNTLIATISSLGKANAGQVRIIRAFMNTIYLSPSESDRNYDLLCIGINGSSRLIVCEMAGIMHCLSNYEESSLNVSTVRIPRIDTSGDYAVTYSTIHAEDTTQVAITLIFRTIQRAKSEEDDKKSSPKSSLTFIEFPSKSVEVVRADCEVIVPVVCTTGTPAGPWDALLSVIEEGSDKEGLSMLNLAAGSFESSESPVYGNVALSLQEPNNKSSIKGTELVWLDWREGGEVVLNRCGNKATRLPVCPVRNSVVSVCACGSCCGRNVPCTCGGGRVVCFDEHRSSWVAASMWME